MLNEIYDSNIDATGYFDRNSPINFD
jgi:hypothetical protein